MTVLHIETAALLRAAALVAADEQEAAALIADRQEGIELSIVPEALGDLALRPLLILAVTDWLAGDLLDQRARAEGAASAVSAGEVEISAARPEGPPLRERARQMLAPYLRRAAAATFPREYGLLSLERQAALFGTSAAEGVAGL